MRLFERSLHMAGLLAALAVAGCGSSPVYEEEAFNSKTPYQYRIAAEPDKVCEAARLALLSQGYVTQESGSNQLKGSKAFQPDSDEHAVLEFNVACAMTPEGTVLYANAVEKRFELKKSSQSAGLSLPAVGSITLPWGGSSESLVLVSAQTISDPEFYKRFYGLVGKELGLASKAK